MEQILALYHSTENNLTSSIVIDLIKRAISNKTIFGFAEFYEPLRLKQQQGLQLSPQALQWLDILQIFTYGTWHDYVVLRDDTMVDSFPDLDPAQIKKLRQLTLVTLASKTKSLSYDDIKVALQLEEEQIEPMIIDTIYAELLDGRIDTKNREVDVLRVAGRDATAERIQEIQEILKDWDSFAVNLLQKTQKDINEAQEIVNKTS